MASDTVSLGLENRISVQSLRPVGLPDDMKADLRAQGLETGDFNLTFGTVEVINHAQVFMTVTL